MGDQVIRHLVALACTIVCALAFYAGYVSGQYGLWWAVFSLVIIYGGVFNLVNK